jgi:hypothetical protein
MSLVELMVAISILAIIMSGLALSIGVDYKAVALARSRQVAESTANKFLEEWRDVDYANLALSTYPTYESDVDNPDHWVLPTTGDGATYDVTGAGQNEALVVNTSTGPVTHIENPVQVGTTVVAVYVYVTWVDDPGIPGLQNLKRITAVVKYNTVPQAGTAKILRESVLLTPGNVTLPDSGTTTTSSSPTTTTSSTPTPTTTVPSACGTYSITGSTGASVGYTASPTVTITMALSGCGTAIAEFSNDGAAWGSDVNYSASNTTLAWALDASGDGTKTVYGQVKDGAGGSWQALNSQSIILDTTKPTTPATLTRSLACSGNDRTVVLLWGASNDDHLTGYHVYVSSGGAFTLLTSTTDITATTTNSKTTASISYYVKAYDAAGNESSASPTITLTKNQCS